MKFVAPTSSDEGQYLISLVVPQSDSAKKAKKSRLQIIPIKNEVEKAPRKKVCENTPALSEDVAPDSAMVEREAMAIFRDYVARIGTIKLAEVGVDLKKDLDPVQKCEIDLNIPDTFW